MASKYIICGVALFTQLMVFSEEPNVNVFKSLIPSDAIERPVVLIDGRDPTSEIKTRLLSRRINYFKDNVKVGERGWHPNGSLAFEAVYSDGLLDGVSYSWYESGKMRAESHYKKGVLEGSVTKWYENGKTQEIMTFHAGKLHGVIRKWNETGTRVKTMDESYIDGKRIGFYNINGESVSKEDYAEATKKNKDLPKLEPED